MSRRRENIEVRSNLKLTVRERGKIVAHREGHNIWLRLGAEWLTGLVQYGAMSIPAYWGTSSDSSAQTQPLTSWAGAGIRGIGVGIGGTQQLVATIPADLATAYPGTNVQTDTDPTVVALERPVRVNNADPAYVDQPLPANYGLYPGDVWLGQVICPASAPTSTSVTFSRLFLPTDVSYNEYCPSVPLSECVLVSGFASPAHPLLYPSYAVGGVAYDTFDSLSKTSAFDLQIDWTLRF